jgi:hypothetical protein
MKPLSGIAKDWLPLAIMSSILSLCGCAAESSAPTTAPRLCVPATISFDEVKVGDRTTNAILLQSCGTDSVIVYSQLLGGFAFTLSDTADRAFRLGVPDSHYVTNQFKPSDTIPYFGFDTIVSSAGTIVVRLLGKGISIPIPSTPGPHLCVDTLIEFDEVMLGNRSMVEVPIKNCGDSMLAIRSQSVEDSNFTLLRSGSMRIPPDSTTIALIQFAPTSAGSKTAVYAITWNSTKIIHLHGVGRR